MNDEELRQDGALTGEQETPQKDGENALRDMETAEKETAAATEYTERTDHSQSGQKTRRKRHRSRWMRRLKQVRPLLVIVVVVLVVLLAKIVMDRRTSSS